MPGLKGGGCCERGWVGVVKGGHPPLLPDHTLTHDEPYPMMHLM